jgi:hypothetical protein
MYPMCQTRREDRKPFLTLDVQILRRYWRRGRTWDPGWHHARGVTSKQKTAEAEELGSIIRKKAGSTIIGFSMDFLEGAVVLHFKTISLTVAMICALQRDSRRWLAMLACLDSSFVTIFDENGSEAHGLTGSGVIFRRFAGLYHFDVFWWLLLSVRVLDDETELFRVEEADGLDFRDVCRKLSWYLDVI